jgi:1-acyl-sn-glycerol-3-phosphate acyltransferase
MDTSTNSTVALLAPPSNGSATRNKMPTPGEAIADAPTQRATRNIPQISRLLLRIFSTYSRWYVARHFHSVRLSAAGQPPRTDALPLVIYVNHASWWDPLVCLLLQNEFFNSRPAYAPIDRAALEQYRFFARVGFFGVEQNSARGAGQFLRTATGLLQRPDSILWLTPQGRFADARERPVGCKPGLGHLPARVERAVYVPLALEYVFWQERKPEILCRFGEMEIIERSPRKDWTVHFEQQLASTQNALAAEALRREAADFQPLLKSGSGVGLAYDAWRRLRARLAGTTFRPGHGRL